MEISKTKLAKIISVIKRSDKKVYTISELAFDTGIKEDVLREYFLKFDPLIYFNSEFNVRDVFDKLLIEQNKLEKSKGPKRHYIGHKELAQYKGLIDYVYKNMTVSGGILDTGYVLNKKDLKLITKLLKNEKDKLKKK